MKQETEWMPPVWNTATVSDYPAQAAAKIAALEARLNDAEQTAVGAMVQSAAMRKALGDIIEAAELGKFGYAIMAIAEAALATDAGKEVLAVVEAAREWAKDHPEARLTVREGSDCDLYDAIADLDGSKTDG